METEYILLRNYNNYVAANISKGMLQQNGIDCYLQDETVSTIMPYWNIANGGVKLMVATSDASDAEKLLSEAENQKSDEDFELGYFSN